MTVDSAFQSQWWTDGSLFQSVQDSRLEFLASSMKIQTAHSYSAFQRCCRCSPPQRVLRRHFFILMFSVPSVFLFLPLRLLAWTSRSIRHCRSQFSTSSRLFRRRRFTQFIFVSLAYLLSRKSYPRLLLTLLIIFILAFPISLPARSRDNFKNWVTGVSVFSFLQRARQRHLFTLPSPSRQLAWPFDAVVCASFLLYLSHSCCLFWPWDLGYKVTLPLLITIVFEIYILQMACWNYLLSLSTTVI